MTNPHPLPDQPIPDRVLRALIVDDEPRYLNSTRLLIAQHFGSVDTAATGREAYRLLEHNAYDIVLLDLMLPDASGHDIMRAIRARRPDTLVIVVSGDAAIEAAIEALRAGAYDFLRKPYEAEELTKTLRNALRQLELHRDNRHFQQRLQQSEHWHRLLVNLSPDIIYTLDAAGRFTYLNESVEGLLGYCRDELLGQPWTAIVPEEDVEGARHRMDERRTGERATRNAELRFRRKSAGPEAAHAAVELSALGLYRDGPDGGAEFLGSYGVARDVSARKEAEATVRFQAYHDLLTGLPNRALFRERLSQALIQARRDGRMLAVMFLDLDRFKVVNDTLGHLVGDKLLQAVSQRVGRCLREGDTLARIGGDEFLLLLPSIRSRESAALIARKILAALDAPFHIEGHELFVTTSIGIAVHPDDGDALETLIKHADLAMYHAKDHGRDGYRFFLPDLNALMDGRLRLENDLRRALQRGEFEVYYQPQVSIADRRIVGMEALVRWHHPDKGMVLPADFIALAEDTGLIAPIGESVMQLACRQASLWQGMGLSSVSLAVNLSARQLEQPRFVEQFTATLQANRLPEGAIAIEITESTLMRDLDGAVAKLKRLCDLGVEISIDDFGTGYSSLSYLKKLPIHTIKIDRSFVHDLDSDGSTIVAGIAAMTKGLKLNLVAEGVETRAQLDYLASVGCDAYQGFLFSQPLSAAQATPLLQPQLH